MGKKGQAQVKDPVCGMDVDPEEAISAEKDGDTYYFCSGHCRDKFLGKEPDTSAEKSEAEPGQYTCPMHPDVVEDEPGDCPECGMALEPVQPGAEQDDAELKDMQRRFWTGLVFTLPVFVIAMSDMIPGLALKSWMGISAANWTMAVLALPVVLWCGLPFFKRGWKGVVNKSPNMFTLIALGSGAAFLFSLLGLIAPGLFPEEYKTDGRAPVFFESAAVIITLVLLGQVLELRARNKTGDAVRELMELTDEGRRVAMAGDGTNDAPAPAAAMSFSSVSVISNALRLRMVEV